METVTYLIFIGVIIALAVYWFADAKSKAKWIQRLQSELEVQRKELREWQNKALIKHGSVPLDKQKARPMRMGQQEITPKVITRQQLEYRETQPMQTPINIHATDVKYQRVAQTVEKAAEIIEAHR